MKSRLFEEGPKKMRTATGRWLRVLPDQGLGHYLYDPVHGAFAGRLLADEQDDWIYDGNTLDPDEQEEVAGFILGYQKEMDKLLKSLNLGNS